MNEKLYCIRCRTEYAILGEAPPKMDETAMYRLLGESIYYPHCFVVERYDRKEYCGNSTWIVHKSALLSK